MVNEIQRLKREKIKYISLEKYKEVAAICHSIGAELSKNGEYEEALELHTEGLHYSEMLNDRFEIAVSNRMLGECYAEDNNFKKALSHIKKYLDIVVDLGNLVEEQRAWATFGRTHYMRYSYELEHNSVSCSKTLDLAEQSYIRALELSTDLKDELGEKDYNEMRARLLLNLGLVCEDRGNSSQCAKYIGKAIALTTKYDLLEDLNRCQSSLANIYKKHGEYSHALHLYDGAIASSAKLQDKTTTCDSLFSKAHILTALKDFEGAKKCLKKAYKLHTSVEEEHERITKCLKHLIGLCEIQKKLQNLDVDEHFERKKLLEKIADTLSALEQYKLAIEFYLSTLKCIENANLSLLEKAPIFYSIAQTYYDDGNYEKACEYFEKEFDCNENKPVERVKTLWKIAEIFEEQQKHENAEEILVKAINIAEKIDNMKLLYYTLEKLKILYESNGITNKLNDTISKLNAINVENFSSDDEDIDVEENTENLFDDLCISDMLTSESDEEKNDGSRRRRRTKKPITKVNEVGETPLHQACIKGNLNMVKKLIDTGQPINARDFSGWTPLHEACNHGWYDIVEYLIDKGADINDRGGEYCGGVTPLHDAASCGHLEIVKLLVSRGASVTVKNDDGETALQALLNWKVSEMKNLDANTLKLCEIVENDLRSSMIQAGQLVENFAGSANGYSPLKSTSKDLPNIVSGQENRTSEKRSRSPSLSPDIDSYEDELPLRRFMNEPRIDLDDAETAQAEYKAAISNVRRSAKTVSPVKKFVPQEKETSLPALLKNTDFVDEWLIKDTDQIPKVKRKRRKMNNLNIRTSKSISNYLIPQEMAEQSVDESNIIVSDDDDNSIVSHLSVDSNPQMNFGKSENGETAFSPAKKKEFSSKQSFCLRVRITDKLILVPVPEETCNIEWLMEEAAMRYQSLTGRKPHLTLMTKEGALLLNTDLIQNIFSNNDEVLSTVKFWIEPSLNDWYEQLCAKHGLNALSSVQKRFQLFESTYKLNFSNCSIASTQLNLIFTSVRNFKTLQHLDISGTVITDDSMNDFLACITSFISLISLNMSCCCITTRGIKLWSECLNNYDSACLFPSLQTLNLSHNVFTPESYSIFVAIFKLPSLINLDLSFCNLNSSFFSKSICNSLKVHAFQNLDISNNDLESDGISEFLVSIQKQSLRILNLSRTANTSIGFGHKLKTFLSEELPSLEEIILSGCDLTNEDLKYVSSIFPFCPKLKAVDLSANPKLSADNIVDFLLCAYEHCVNITKLSSCGTFLWQSTNIELFAKVFNHEILDYFCTDKCSHDLSEDLFNVWKDVWKSKAICMNRLFCELKIA